MEMIEGFELSPQQKHLWKLQSSSSDLPYRAQCAVQIKGKIEPSTLKAAIAQLISSHEILHTTFNSVPGMTLPLQVIASDCNFNFSVHDYTGMDLEAQVTQIKLLWKQYNELPFDFSQNSLFHSTLITLSEEDSVLLVNLPALYVDIKGLDNLILKISQSYSAYTQGKEFYNEVLQYVDISEWQNQISNDEEQEIILAKGYWRKYNITDFLSIKLPFETQFTQESVFNPRYLSSTLPPSQVEQISEFIQKNKISIDLFFLASWQILLWRLTQKPEVFIGVSCENRKYEDLQDSIGLLAKYLPLKSSLQEGVFFHDVIKQIQLELNNIHTWQEYFSWESILDESKIYINSAFVPFAFDFTKHNKYITNDICFSIIKRDICFDKFKVKLSLTQNEHDIITQLYYDANLFHEDSIQCIAEQFQTLLSSILDNPEKSIEKLGIISNSHREKILVNFNDTSYDYPKDKSIHQLFEEQVEKTPEAVAVVFQNQQLSYYQLNQRANQIARYLQSLGVKAEQLVGICVERSIEMVVGLLGILKAGGAYVPLDPNYPQKRLSYMLTDSGVNVLLTQQSLLKSLPENQAQVVYLDTDWGEISQHSTDNLSSGVKAENLAYVIYTSGSTGKPKGVAIEHRSVLNLAEGLHKAIYAQIQDSPLRISLNASFSFDASVQQLVQLLDGHTLNIIPTMVRFDGDALLSYLQEHKIDVFDCTPSQMELLISAGLLLSNNVPKYFLVGGEAISPALWQTLTEANSINFYNLYGPTECTVDTILCQLQTTHSQPVIGRPIINTQVYILDKDLQPLPIGVSGELYIGGDGLARGYHNSPELTREKFIQNPFRGSTGAQEQPLWGSQKSKVKSQKLGSREQRSKGDFRLYKTGDLARYLPDGNIEYLGRIDNQVKIRGFRIELGEIEAALNIHTEIEQAVVILREDLPGNKRLVAYVVTSDKSLNTTELREFISSKVPDYMVPSSFVILDSLPLTPNGKIDKKALPAPDGDILRVREYIAPRTPNEEMIANIFASVLGVENVSIHDNFFELGGHSLLATQVTSRVRQVFSVELPLPQIFETPSVVEFAEAITELQLQSTQDEDIDQVLAELDDLSEEEVQKILSQEKQLYFARS
ncbi:non-ribosomal peptide synthetase [Aetokthonos hydrillicola Thurmond2011]|jgi:amino acid adenylation domain-containing protein|uniref:Non-ribosomal peptide synthetase n=1 Tax=Aetokthonos hydrillicola Thurmond2011 TaxID=2712845 RepID=A0AAP5MBL2_9CYAN|nr:non-ribosomal peptide synthetase [Aetokthonos hydrillicola]MBO3458676.1 amino acid adenylation domain-containing protein [Aetokthonos hydrillicola CCALA 1050]MBW4588029.1 amino acid adenylation domain-containing protein [Aetokthonos hydrillicola CCALA 1050]MDR9897019.1 non-ribosomal peptide synthetase [Aetokthonos hydrillicola Thurmond2011]